MVARRIPTGKAFREWEAHHRVGYVPDIRPSVLKEATNNGFQVVTNINDLIEFIS